MNWSELVDGRPRVLGLGGTLREGSRSRAALAAALDSAEATGARTELLSLQELNLPLFRPGRPMGSYSPAVERLLQAARHADGMIWSTAGYHGTLAGATKNALDFFEFLAEDDYLSGRPVGLIAVSGGDMAAVNAIDAMVHTVHALRGSALSLKVPIGGVRRAIGPDGEIRDGKAGRRLASLGGLVAEEARRRLVSHRALA